MLNTLISKSAKHFFSVLRFRLKRSFVFAYTTRKDILVWKVESRKHSLLPLAKWFFRMLPRGVSKGDRFSPGIFVVCVSVRWQEKLNLRFFAAGGKGKLLFWYHGCWPHVFHPQFHLFINHHSHPPSAFFSASHPRCCCCSKINFTSDPKQCSSSTKG